MSDFEQRELNVTDVVLDIENFRLGEQEGQVKTIMGMVEKEQDKIISLDFMSQMGQFLVSLDNGKRYREFLVSSLRADSTDNVCRARGTAWGRFIFILCSRISHRSPLISSHSARRISPGRPKVSRENFRAHFMTG